MERLVSYIINVMKTTAIPVERKRGRPRNRNTQKAILKAAAEIVLASGLAGMTMEGVAARAGVGKASIYRRWPSKGALAFDATLDEYLTGQPTRDTGSLEGDLLATARDWIRSVKRSPCGRPLKGLIAEAQSDRSLAEAMRDRIVRQV